ncbi:FIG00762612: hypothetical protein [hydrothermal vent metagenome]|uniref:DUF1697 domain-containing protein n=1 Tax=hydrothermal vent metagenome TaxID=652676 RepID=A0A3B0YTW0_9ZZZZ
MKYISVLRGINVSGQKKIKMADLKALYEAQGFKSVTTYIQSGNVIFESKGADVEDLKKVIEQAIEEKYAFHVPVDIRTSQELKAIVSNCPYEEAEAEENSTKVLVTFLNSIPEKQNMELLLGYVKPPERLTIQGSEVYLYCPNSYGKSKLTNTFVESKLGVSATTRNWKSVKTLYELSSR